MAKRKAAEEASGGGDASHERYDNPLAGRYASDEMNFMFSPQKKFSTWRRLWVALAQAEFELGLDCISQAQIDELRAKVDTIDFEAAEAHERKLKHDVMAHIHAFGDVCPNARPIIHLGATSCFVGDNTDVIQMKGGLELVQAKLLGVIHHLRKFCDEFAAMPTLGFTHFQPAQLTTVGKRASLWLQDFYLDHQHLETLMNDLPLRGVKGTTGTQATFLDLFNGDHDKVCKLDKRVCELMGFDKSIWLTGQTYTRKLDYLVLSALSAISQSAYKMAGDIRLLMHLKEMDEPFEKNQVGSSAMAYKRNPMRSERICSLSRYVMSLPINAANTHSNQWMERTLDDSANRRLTLPQAFLGIDAVLNLCTNVVDGLHVWPLVVRKHIDQELPFMATENILMECVRAGGDRQELHEAIRELSMLASKRVKEEGLDNDLLIRIAADTRFSAIHNRLSTLVEPSLFIGRAEHQVKDFLREEIDPLLSRLSKKVPKGVAEMKV